MTDWRDDLDRGQRERLRRTRMPAWTRPMLATLTDKRFSSPEWIFERKLDGERCLVFRRKSRLHILSRNRQDLNATYPELVEALAEQSPGHFIVDGEIVAFDGNTTSFSRLQGRLGIKQPEEARASGIKVWLYLFDLLYLDRYDTTGLALRTRKQLLRRQFDFGDPLRFTAHHNANGTHWYRRACRRGWEGLIAKRADSPYLHSRSRHWLKFKCVNRQELVIGGYTDPGGSRTGFGALLLGYYENGTLRYAGKVGTGFDRATLQDLGGKLASLERKSCPYAGTPDVAGGGVHWVKPELVAEIGFTEWTNDKRLRHPRFLGLRHDKAPRKVVREAPQ
ncbi:MAG: non-homologous end-joining DNA ligase [Gammaproteobacteria bacterium]|jgi:DNA ligase D-like protein (predicted ligase)